MAKKRYANLDQVSTDKSLRDMRNWQKERRAKVSDRSYTVPQCARKQTAFLQANRQATTVTWIGHSTFLIQFGGLNIVTDPVWAQRMGFAKRESAPGLAIAELPAIDVVLLSHAHYDHLHIGSLRALPGKPLLLVPEGLSGMLRRKGFANVKELPWWEGAEIGGVRFDMVPAQHWTRRTLWDTNTSHWGGFIIRRPELREAPGREAGNNSEHADSIYFAGDSGYFRGFKEIGRAYNIGTALLPIGAYDPEWFMKVSHMSPEEAVQAYRDLGARAFIPMHYGAYRLADDTAGEALGRLAKAWEAAGLPAEELRVLELGETLRVEATGEAAAAINTEAAIRPEVEARQERGLAPRPKPELKL